MSSDGKSELAEETNTKIADLCDLLLRPPTAYAGLHPLEIENTIYRLNCRLSNVLHTGTWKLNISPTDKLVEVMREKADEGLWNSLASIMTVLVSRNTAGAQTAIDRWIFSMYQTCKMVKACSKEHAILSFLFACLEAHRYSWIRNLLDQGQIILDGRMIGEEYGGISLHVLSRLLGNWYRNESPLTVRLDSKDLIPWAKGTRGVLNLYFRGALRFDESKFGEFIKYAKEDVAHQIGQAICTGDKDLARKILQQDAVVTIRELSVGINDERLLPPGDTQLAYDGFELFEAQCSKIEAPKLRFTLDSPMDTKEMAGLIIAAPNLYISGVIQIPEDPEEEIARAVRIARVRYIGGIKDLMDELELTVPDTEGMILDYIDPESHAEIERAKLKVERGKQARHG